MAPKHSRSGSESDADEDVRFIKIIRGSPSSASSLATFVDLPFELRTTILDLATQRRPKSGEAVSGSEARERLRLDYGTIFSLSLVSRHFYHTLSPLLWRHVKLTRPSALISFRQSLIADPRKATLVKSLHIGPVRQLPQGWWPARYKEPGEHDWQSDEPIDLLKTSLSKHEGHLLPRWCKPGSEWAYSLPARSCQGAAVNGAIYSALDAAGVTIGDPEYHDGTLLDEKGHPIGINEWTERVFETQGVLDLYLCEMRRIEDAENRPVIPWRAAKTHPAPRASSKCRSRECSHYPKLVLEGFDRSTKKGSKSASSKGNHSSQKTFTITRDQVKAHLLRPGALTDDFEHPLLFAWSGLRMLAMGPGCSIVIDHDQREIDAYYGFSSFDDDHHEYGDFFRYNDDAFSQSSDSPQGSPRSTSSGLSTSSDSNDSFDASHRDGLVALARSVLYRTVALENLSLTGFLHLSLGREPPALTTLRCLSVGPGTSPPTLNLSLSVVQLPSLVKLRCCADYLNTGIAKRIAGTKKHWPSLREIRWDFGGSHDQVGYSSVPTLTINYMQGRGDGGTAGSALIAHSQTASGDAASGQDTLPNKAPDGPSSRYIEIRLHSTRISAILEKAPSPEIRRAWLEGLPLTDAPNRIRLVRCQGESAERLYYSPGKLHSFHCKEAEQWWEEAAFAIERGEQLTLE